MNSGLNNNGGIIGGVAKKFYSVNDEYVIDNAQFVGGKAVGLVGSFLGQTVSLTGLTGGTGDRPIEGDLVIVAVEICGITSKGTGINTSGYTALAFLYANDTEDSNFTLAYKFMGSTPDTSISIITRSGDDAGAVSIGVWRNVDLYVTDVATTTNTQLNTAIPNPPAITPVTPGTRVIVAAGAAHGAGTQTFGATYLNDFFTAGGNDVNDATVGMGWVAWTSGTYDPAAWTFSGADNAAYSTNSATVALRPATRYVQSGNVVSRSGIWSNNSVLKRKGTYSFQYYRFNVTAIRGGGADSYTQVGRFAFMLDGFDIFMELAGATNTSGSSPGGEEPFMIADKSLTTKWLNFTGAGTGVQFNFGQAVPVNGYRWFTANDSSFRDPISWSIQGSSDAVTWITLDTVTNASVTSSRLAEVGPYVFA